MEERVCLIFLFILKKILFFSVSFCLQLQFEISCGDDKKCVDNLNLDFNFTR